MATERKLPVRLKLYLVNDTRPWRGDPHAFAPTEHEFWLRIEGPSGATALVGGETVSSPWLRAMCSCGWQATNDQLVVIEENAHWRWINHAEET